MSAQPAPRTAFVLAGGGSLGAVQVGMLKALSRHGIVPDLVVGASVGAINGAYYAAEPSEAGIARLERIWRRLRSADVFPFSMHGAALCLLGRRDHLALPARLRALIESELPYRRLEDAPMACHVVATDALDGTEVVLSSGDVTNALLASSAIPVVFPAVVVAERALIDGGIASHTPISVAVALGATRVFILPTGTSCALRTPPRGVIAIALHALNLMAMRQLLADIDRIADHCELIVVPPLCPLITNTYDFSQTDKLLRRAEAATASWLAGGLQNPDPRWALSPHRHSLA